MQSDPMFTAEEIIILDHIMVDWRDQDRMSVKRWVLNFMKSAPMASGRILRRFHSKSETNDAWDCDEP